MKKILAIALVLCLAMSLLPGVALAAENVTEVNDAESLKDAVAKGGNIKLIGDIALTEALTVTKDVSIDGANNKITTEATRGILIASDNVTLVLSNLTLDGMDRSERAVQVNIGKKEANITIDNCKIEKFTYYALNFCNDSTAWMTVTDSTISAWSAVNAWTAGHTFEFENSTLIGINDKPYNAEGWNGFGVVVLEADTTGQESSAAYGNEVTLTKCNIIAESTTENSQCAILFNGGNSGGAKNNSVTLTGGTISVEKSATVIDNGTGNSVSINNAKVIVKAAEALPEAVKAVKYGAGNVIQLSKNINLRDNSIAIDAADNIAVDLNGHTIESSNDYTVMCKGTLELTDSGSAGSIINTNAGKGTGIVVMGGTLNLKGGTISCPNYRAVTVDGGGTLNMTGGTATGKYGVRANGVESGKTTAVLSGGKVIGTEQAVYVQSNVVFDNSTKKNVEVTITDNVEVYTVNDESNTGSCAVTVRGNGAVLNVTGGTISSYQSAITGNGTVKTAAQADNSDGTNYGKTVINISGGVIKSTGGCPAIYHPQEGTLNVTGGELSGHGGIQLCSGVGTIANISGNTTVTATGTDGRASKTGDGYIPDGAAISIVNRNYPGGTPKVSISGGSFTSEKSTAIMAYTWNNNEASDWNEAKQYFTITGGTYSSDPSDYVASGYTTSASNGTFTVNPIYIPGPAPDPEPPVVEVPVKGDEATVTVPVQVDKGEASLVIDEEKLAEVVESGAATGTVTIDVSGLGQDVKTVNVPSDTISAINTAVQEEGGKAEGLAVSLPAATIEFDGAALDEVAKVSGAAPEEPVTITAEQVEHKDLPAEQQAVVGEDAVILDLTVKVGENAVSDFAGGTVTVTLDYTPKPGADTSKIIVWFLSDDGKLTPCECEYVNGKLSFKTGHFSKYVVGEFPFTDVKAGEWYYENVVYAYANGLMNGVSDTVFEPMGSTSRAMIVTMLWRLEKEPVANYAMSFEDVAADQWYTEPIRWAASEKLVEGYSDTSFGPDDAITREQLAVILWRYAKYKGWDVSIGEDTNILSFVDAEQISEYAIPALQWACGSKLINGKEGGVLDPQGSATRAETAAVFQRMMSK